MASKVSADDVNLLSAFLANSQLPELSTSSVDTIVICVSAVLHPAEKLFATLELNPSLTKSLVLCGGIGHSTPLIYEAVARHPVYQTISGAVEGLPESRVLLTILESFFDVAKIKSAGCRIFVEDVSTNCGANAVESRRVLDEADQTPKKMVLIQDPTMSIRTKAAFDQVYSNLVDKPEVLCWPGFVPRVRDAGGQIEFDTTIVSKDGLWTMERFLNLIMGEIPRLELYGPNGKGSIAHVEVPHEVAEAWNRLRVVLDNQR